MFFFNIFFFLSSFFLLFFFLFLIVIVKKCGIEISVAILFGTLGVFFLVLIAYKWRMNNKLGITFLVIYILYIIFILLSAFPVGAPVLDVSGGCVEPLPPLGCPGNMGLPAANASLAN